MGLRAGIRVKSYLINDLLAKGGMGEVWRAWDSHNNCHVAVKSVAADLVDDAEFKTRFADELRRHGRLSHPHIVQVLDTFEWGSNVCCVMQLIEGESLASYLKRRGRLTVEESAAILRDVLDALDYAHRQGIVHRDIKPSNILLDRQHRAYLIDFGIALAIGEKRRTRAGVAVGTPEYMSPEQIVRPYSLDQRTDIYSLGCVLYEMLTGQPPFRGDRETGAESDMAVKTAHVKTPPVPPSRRVPGLPVATDRLVLWALEKKPNDRLPDCRVFACNLTLSNVIASSDVKPRGTGLWHNLIFLSIAVYVFAFGGFYLLLRYLGL